MTNLRLQKASSIDLLYLSVLSLFFLVFALDRGSLASWDEALYASVAKEIVLSGDWFRLTYEGAPWFDKPPLAIWATAVFFKLLGTHELAARLFSALCGAGAVLMTYFLAARLFDRWIGFLSAAVLLNSMHFIRYARFGMLDAPLVFFLSLAFYFFLRGKERNRYLIFSGLSLGLAFLTKGFAAFLFFPAIILYALWAREEELVTRSSFWIGMMIAAAMALPWHVFEFLSGRERFMQDAVVKHLILRTLTPLEGHEGNWYYYIRVFINKYHPWVLVAVWSVPFFIFKAARERRFEWIFIASWILSMFAIITLIQTKLPWYILPLYPAASITVGYVLSRFLNESQKVLVMVLFVGAMALHVPFSHLFNADYSAGIKGIAGEVKKRVPQEAFLSLYNLHDAPAAHFYTERRINYVDSPEEFTARVQSSKPFYCLVQDKEIAAIGDAIKSVKTLAAFGDLKLVSSAP